MLDISCNKGGLVWTSSIRLLTVRTLEDIELAVQRGCGLPLLGGFLEQVWLTLVRNTEGQSS